MEVGEIKSIDFETRMALENITKVSVQGDGSVIVLDSAMAVWEYCSCAKFGKMIAKLTEEEKAELNAMSKNDMTELGRQARVHYENPSQG